MNKKDRIAVVTTIVPLLILFPELLRGKEDAFVLVAILSFYWGYRFIKNDISFLKIKDE